MGLNTAILLTERALLSESPSFPAECIGAHRHALPLLVRFGITTEQEVDVDTYAQRLREEVVGLQSYIVMPHMVGALVLSSQKPYEPGTSEVRYLDDPGLDATAL